MWIVMVVGCRIQDGKDRNGSKKGTEVRLQIDQRSAAAGHLGQGASDKAVAATASGAEA